MVESFDSGVVGRVIEPLPNGMFRVELEDGTRVVAHVGARMRLHFVQVLPGDQVTLELSPYDRSRGKITRRIER